MSSDPSFVYFAGGFTAGPLLFPGSPESLPSLAHVSLRCAALALNQSSPFALRVLRQCRCGDRCAVAGGVMEGFPLRRIDGKGPGNRGIQRLSLWPHDWRRRRNRRSS